MRGGPLVSSTDRSWLGAQPLGGACTEVVVDIAPAVQGAPEDRLDDAVAMVADDVADQPLARCVVEDDADQRAGLLEVVILLMRRVGAAGSRAKNTGVLLPTLSQVPSDGCNFTEKPRGSRCVSAAPCSPAAVANWARVSVSVSVRWANTAALVNCETSSVAVNTRNTPPPLACTTRSSTRSRLD
jgi:hypothetical protein